MKFIEKYIELRSIVQTWGLKETKTKNIPVDWGKLKCQEKVLQLLLEATQSLKVEEDYKILSQTNCKFTFWCFYIQLFRFIKNFHFFIKHFTKPSLKNISLIIVSFLFSFKLKIIPSYCSRCVSISFSERIDSYPIRLVSLSESKRSNPPPYENHVEKNMFQWKQKAYPIW